MYSKLEVYKSTLEYFKGDELKTDIWIEKYCLRQTNDVYLELNPTDMHKRLASEFYRIESKYPNPLDKSDIFELLEDFKYIREILNKRGSKNVFFAPRESEKTTVSSHDVFGAFWQKVFS
jgi:hypothetical protein